MYPWVSHLESTVISKDKYRQIVMMEMQSFTWFFSLILIEKSLMLYRGNMKKFTKNAFVMKMPKFIEKFIINEGNFSVFTEFLPMNDEISEGLQTRYINKMQENVSQKLKNHLLEKRIEESFKM